MSSTAAMEMTLEYSLQTDNCNTLQAPPTALVSGGGPSTAPTTLGYLQSALTLHREMYDELLESEREALNNVKTQLDDVDLRAYYATRDALFTLAHSGGDGRINNRAGHKLKESMDATGVWEVVLKGILPEHKIGGFVPSMDDEEEEEDDEEEVVLPADEEAVPAVKPKKSKPKQLAFADVCGGPGSFAQVLYQTAPKNLIKLQGYGLTLLDAHRDAPQGWYPELSTKHGFIPCFGVDGKGDIYNTSNIVAFHTLVRDEPMKLVVADGGFEVSIAEANIQEVLSARIVYSQWYTALRILKPGGCFVLKLFDAFTPFTRSLFYLSTKFYGKVHIVKPKHSRIVNSERYLVCLDFNKFEASPSEEKKEDVSSATPALTAVDFAAWMEYLQLVHQEGFTQLQAPVSVVPVEWMEADTKFTQTNQTCCKDIANRQRRALERLVASDELKDNMMRAAEAKARLAKISRENERGKRNRGGH